MCDENYYGNPEVPGGSCRQCSCNNNVDITKAGNCDPHSGKCLQCLYNTEGDNCEVCKTGFYGDAFQPNCIGDEVYHNCRGLNLHLGPYIEIIINNLVCTQNAYATC